MVKSHRSKRQHKKHRGGEGESTENNSVLNMDDAPASETAAPAPATETAMPAPATASATPAEEEKKGWFSNLFGGSKTKRVRFKTGRKTKRSSAKRSTRKHKRSSAKRSSAKRSGSKRSSSKRKGSRK